MAISLIFFMYNFAMTPIICVWSLIFTKPSFGRAFVTIFNVIIGELFPSSFFFLLPLCSTVSSRFSFFSVPALYLINFLIRVWLQDDTRSYDPQHFFLWPYPLMTMFDAIFRLEYNQNYMLHGQYSMFTSDKNNV